MQSIHFDAETEVDALLEEEWAQFCKADKCGIRTGTLAVGCYNPNGQSQPPPAGKTDKLDCPEGHVIEVIYAHWDHIGVQSLDAITCRRVLPLCDTNLHAWPPSGSTFHSLRYSFRKHGAQHALQHGHA